MRPVPVPRSAATVLSLRPHTRAPQHGYDYQVLMVRVHCYDALNEPVR